MGWLAAVLPGSTLVDNMLLLFDWTPYLHQWVCPNTKIEESISPIRQYDTRSGTGLLSHIPRHKKNHKILRETFLIIIDTAFRFSLFCVLFSTVVLSFFYYIIKFVVSAVTLLVCLINVLDLHVVSIAKLYVIKNLNLNSFQKLNSQVCLLLQMCCVVFCYLIDL